MSDETTTENIPTLLSQLELYKNNPYGIQRVIYEHLKNVTDGKIKVVDPTNSFVFLNEMTTVLISAFMNENRINTRRQYPRLAQTVEELYLHMHDGDYIDRFASPAKTTFKVMFSKRELLSKMVQDPVTGVKKITIPRHTEFIAGDYVFSLQYPIDIKQFTHGGIQCVYDTSETSPLQTLTTNIVKFSESVHASSKEPILTLEVEVYQFQITSYWSPLTSSTGYKKTHTFKDSFYHARVWTKSSLTGNVWTEIYTTHTDQVYDHTKPTALLQVIGNNLTVKIPEVYFTNDLISGNLRVDIYQTKGEMKLITNSLPVSSFSANWKTIEKEDVTPEIAATRGIANVMCYTLNTIVGGKDELTFEELRERVINNTVGPRVIPITNVQVKTVLQNNGFGLVANIDNVTNRVFLATKQIPTPVDEILVTPASASVNTIVLSMDDATLHPYVCDNGGRITLTPKILYRVDNGIVSMVEYSEFATLQSLALEELAKAVNSNGYFYTPFHYVLDSTDVSFDMRPYHLNKPTVQAGSFVDANDTTMMQVASKEYQIEKTDTGYVLLVKTTSDEIFKALDDSQVHVQLAYTPVGEDNTAYLLGQQVGQYSEDGERLFKFDLDSNFDIDSDDNLCLTSFKMYNDDPRKFFTPLEFDFDLIYSTSALLDPAWSSGTIDDSLGKFQLPTRIAAITHEKVKIEFGKSLKNLWANTRTVPTVQAYKTYDVDIYQVYDENVYEIDPETGAAFSFDTNGEIVYNILHHVGDPVLDALGNPVVKYAKGDIIYDIFGNPTPLDEGKVKRQIDLMFLEGCLYFANSPSYVEYRDMIVETIVTWVTDDLASITGELLEKTKVYFYPKATIGPISVYNESGIKITIEAAQVFDVTLYVDESVYTNTSLRQAIRTTTIKTIDTHLRSSTVSVSTLTDMLRDAYGGDVLAFDITGFGDKSSMSMLTVVNEGDRCSIRKKLTSAGDGTLIIQENVNVDFVLHRKVEN